MQQNIVYAFRSIMSSKVNMLINVFGLGTAAAAFLLLMHYVHFEKSFEAPHSRADRISRVTIDLYNGPEMVGTDCETYPPLGPELKKRFPEVEEYVRFQDFSPVELADTNRVIALEKMYLADPSVFRVFDYKLSDGDRDSALSRPMQAVITERIAKNMFGSAPAIGKVIKINNHPIVVTGILKDLPDNTHLRFEVLVSFSSLPQFGGDSTTWNGNNNYTYLLLKQSSDATSLNAKLKAFAKERLKNENLVAQNIRDIHLYSNRAFEPDINGDSKTVSFLNVVAVLIVIVGCINYINLITANASHRSKESGMRRLLGSSRMALMRRYLAETLLVTVFAFGLALVVLQISYPYYVSLTGRDFSGHIFSSSYFWSMYCFVFTAVLLVSGTYPAFILSSVKPVSVIRRTFTQSSTGNLFRKALVVGQFTVAIVVLISATLIYRQVQYLRTQDAGMNASELLVLKGPIDNDADSVHRQKIRSFRNALLSLPGISEVAISGAVPGENLSQLNTTTGVTRIGNNVESGYNYCNYDIDENFIPTLQMKLLAGRNFRTGNVRNEVILNEEACRLLGFRNAESAIGEKISYARRGFKFSVVVGVLKNYKQRSAKESMLPMIHTYQDRNDSYYTLKIASTNFSSVISAVERNWKQAYPENAFQYFFLDEMIERQYKADLRFGTIIGIFSGLTFFITCLGILGLTAATIAKRTREIGIRKVLGASVHSIISLISFDFIKLVCISVVVASPLAWLLMNEWLKDYDTRINIGWQVFVIAAVLALLVALITISYQAVRAATANPVDSLKAE